METARRNGRRQLPDLAQASSSAIGGAPTSTSNMSAIDPAPKNHFLQQNAQGQYGATSGSPTHNHNYGQKKGQLVVLGSNTETKRRTGLHDSVQATEMPMM